MDITNFFLIVLWITTIILIIQNRYMFYYIKKENSNMLLQLALTVNINDLNELMSEKQILVLSFQDPNNQQYIDEYLNLSKDNKYLIYYGPQWKANMIKRNNQILNIYTDEKGTFCRKINIIKFPTTIKMNFFNSIFTK
ncbi:hypothetical protein C8Z91_34265 [Paenibacillus elgii]|uniref:Uncharacterized protein n=1 Tax=Paenibacillus elgii TaxID=189691 RepID=A0A2T6FSQ0_9BACL|nr:hypothetical protein C8Z91_34265 [Paenibacillus elgii]